MGKIKDKYLFQYKLNIDNEPMLICDYIDKKNITVYFPCLNLWKRTSISSFKKGLVFPYEHRHYSNEYNIQSDFVQVFCYDAHGKCKGSFLVDYLDFYKIKDAHWKFDKDGYPFSEKYGKLHQYLIPTPKGHEVDHINRNTLDNRKANLRHCTSSENKRNNSRKTKETASKTGYKNIEKVYGNKYRASVSFDGKRYKSKTYNTIEEAIQWRNTKMNELHKEFVNFGEVGVYDG